MCILSGHSLLRACRGSQAPSTLRPRLPLPLTTPGPALCPCCSSGAPGTLCLRAFAPPVPSAWGTLFQDTIRAHSSPSFKFHPNVLGHPVSHRSPPTHVLSPLPCFPQISALPTDALDIGDSHVASCLPSDSASPVKAGAVCSVHGCVLSS